MAQRVVLTDRLLKSLKPAPTGQRAVHWDATRPSFGIRITERGVVSFFVMRRMPGRPQPVRISLGRYPDISLAKARVLATAAIGDLVAASTLRPASGSGAPRPSPHSPKLSSPGPPPPSTAPPMKLERRSAGI